MSAFALLFDLTISAPKHRAACIGPARPNPSLIIRGPGWTPTTVPIRTKGSITILALTIDISTAQTTQPQHTRSTLALAATVAAGTPKRRQLASIVSFDTESNARRMSQLER